MKHDWIISLIGAVSLLPLLANSVLAQPGKKNIKADLEGFQEVPVISTTGEGEFRARINGAVNVATIDYELTYSDLEGGAVLFAHIHLGQRDVNGGVVVFLCGGGTKPDPCPSSGTVTGTLTSADVLGSTAQGIDPGQMGELVEAIRAGNTYVNVHTEVFPTGEVRGQVR